MVRCGGLVLVLPGNRAAQDKHKAPAHPHHSPLSLRTSLVFAYPFQRAAHLFALCTEIVPYPGGRATLLAYKAEQ